MDIRPIETEYNGYKFRSRLEARWAVFFDALGIPYEYEKEGFDLGEDGRYLPDFWLSSAKRWVEIKGNVPTVFECGLCERLAALGRPVDLLWGNIGQHKGYEWWQRPSDGTILHGPANWALVEMEGDKGVTLISGFMLGLAGDDVRADFDASIVHNAYIKARSARFEYDARAPHIRFTYRP